jgi:heat shock protein HslJ
VVVLLLVAGFLVLVLVAANPSGPNDTLASTYGVPNLPRDLAAHLWVFDPPRSSVATAGAGRVTLTFGTRGVSGQGPCNNYHASVSIDTLRDTLQITDLGHTTQSCGASTDKAEREYFAALQAVHHIHLSGRGNRLVLDNSVGDRLAYNAHGSRSLFDGY